MEQITPNNEAEKKEISIGKRIVNAIRKNVFDLREVMGNAQEDELNLIINKIETLNDPKDKNAFELYDAFIKLNGYDPKDPNDASERKIIRTNIRAIIDDIFSN